MSGIDIYVSVVIPAYNEEARIGGAVADTIGYFKNFPRSWELVIVDDGSVDRTRETLGRLKEGIPNMRILALERNQGKGAAIRHGMLNAQGRFRLFRDADGSTQMAEFDKFIPFLEKGVPVVIGSRRSAGSHILHRQPWLRESLGKGFTLLCRLLFVRTVVDYTCGFKCFSASAAREVFSRQRVLRWAFDAEILYIAKKLGLAIAQVPISWNNDTGTKVRLWLDPLRTFWEIAVVRLNGLLGRYDPSHIA